MAASQQVSGNAVNEKESSSFRQASCLLGCSIIGAAAAVMAQTLDHGEHHGVSSEVFLVACVIGGIAFFKRNISSPSSYKAKKIDEDDVEHSVSEAYPEDVAVPPDLSSSEEIAGTIAPTTEADLEDLEDLASQSQVDEDSSAIVQAIADLGDASRLDCFFERMQLSGLDPSIMFHDALMNVCVRNSAAYKSEKFLGRMLRLGSKAEYLTGAFGEIVEICSEANDLMFSRRIYESYSAIVHASNLMD